MINSPGELRRRAIQPSIILYTRLGRNPCLHLFPTQELKTRTASFISFCTNSSRNPCSSTDGCEGTQDPATLASETRFSKDEYSPVVGIVGCALSLETEKASAADGTC